jgi:hypothetical protein
MAKEKDIQIACAERLQAAADALKNEGADSTAITLALIDVIVDLAYEDRPWAFIYLEAAAATLSKAAQGARLIRKMDDLRAKIEKLKRRKRRKK